MRKRRHDEVFRITGARQGLADDVRGRQRRYVISMSVRTVAVIAAAGLWNVERHVAIVALVLGAVLPYVAVVIANAGRESAPSLPSAYLPPPVRPALGASEHEPAGERRTTPPGAGGPGPDRTDRTGHEDRTDPEERADRATGRDADREHQRAGSEPH